jgi:hypothetical protein
VTPEEVEALDKVAGIGRNILEERLKRAKAEILRLMKENSELSTTLTIAQARGTELLEETTRLKEAPITRAVCAGCGHSVGMHNLPGSSGGGHGCLVDGCPCTRENFSI